MLKGNACWAVFVSCLFAVTLVHCGGDSNGSGSSGGKIHCSETEEYDYFTIESPGQACDDGFSCDSCSTSSSCQRTIELDYNYTSGVCTITCESNSDCDSMSLDPDDFDFDVQTWLCEGGYCAVEASRDLTPADPCSSCLAACHGLSGCCTGSGCLCEDECN